MRQIVTRRFKSKAGFVNAAILSEAESADQLENEPLVVVLARRDLVFLQALFAALQCGGPLPDINRMQRAVKSNLDSLTNARNSSTKQPSESAGR